MDTGLAIQATPLLTVKQLGFRPPYKGPTTGMPPARPPSQGAARRLGRLNGAGGRWRPPGEAGGPTPGTGRAPTVVPPPRLRKPTTALRRRVISAGPGASPPVRVGLLSPAGGQKLPQGWARRAPRGPRRKGRTFRPADSFFPSTSDP